MTKNEQRTAGRPSVWPPDCPRTEAGSPSDASQAVHQLGEALTRFLSAFRARELKPGELTSALHLLGRVEKAVAAAGMVTAARMVVDPGEHRRAPELRTRIVVQQCAEVWGVSAAAARSAVDAGIKVISGPGLEAALQRGRLSRPQVVLACQSAGDKAADAASLLATPDHLSLHNWRARHRRLQRLAPVPGHGEGQVRELDRSWEARSWVDGLGVWHLRATGTPENGERVISALGRAGYSVVTGAAERSGPALPAPDGPRAAPSWALRQAGAHPPRPELRQNARPMASSSEPVHRPVFLPSDLAWLTDPASVPETSHGQGQPVGAEPP